MDVYAESDERAEAEGGVEVFPLSWDRALAWDEEECCWVFTRRGRRTEAWNLRAPWVR